MAVVAQGARLTAAGPIIAAAPTEPAQLTAAGHALLDAAWEPSRPKPPTTEERAIR